MSRIHCELIKAWADGERIEIETENAGWQEERTPCFYANKNYRIKPEVRKYRVGLLNGISGKYITTVESSANEKLIETHPPFIKWITNWVEYEI